MSSATSGQDFGSERAVDSRSYFLFRCFTGDGSVGARIEALRSMKDWASLEGCSCCSKRRFVHFVAGHQGYSRIRTCGELTIEVIHGLVPNSEEFSPRTLFRFSGEVAFVGSQSAAFVPFGSIRIRRGGTPGVRSHLRFHGQRGAPKYVNSRS